MSDLKTLFSSIFTKIASSMRSQFETSSQYIPINMASEIINNYYDPVPCIERTIQTYTNSTITSIGTYAFCYCKSLSSIDLPAASYIASQAFEGCTVLSTVNIPNVTNIQSWAFQGCGLITLSLPNLYYTGSAFAFCSSLTTVNLPNITSIHPMTFYQCSSLSSVSLPNVTSIGNEAFAFCTSLSTISLPKLSYIGRRAFCECTSLASLYLLGSSVCSIGSIDAFYNTPMQTTTTGKIYVPASLYDTYKTTYAIVSHIFVSV